MPPTSKISTRPTNLHLVVILITIIASIAVYLVSYIFSTHQPSLVAVSQAVPVQGETSFANYAHNGIFLSAQELEWIKQNHDSIPQLQQFYSRLIQDADDALLDDNTYSVVSNGGRAGYSEHTFAYADDFRAAKSAARHSVNLALAYHLTGQDKYARKAIATIKTWFVNQQTRINSTIIQDSRTVSADELYLGVSTPGLLYSADLLRSHPSLTPSDIDTIATWSQEISQHILDRNTSGRTNYRGFRTLLVLTAGIFSQDQQLLQWAHQETKALIQLQIAADGSLPWEEARTAKSGDDSLYYAHYSLNALTLLAEAGRHVCMDFYNYTPDNNPTPRIQRAYDYLADYVLGRKRWPFDDTRYTPGSQLPKVNPDMASPYYLAHSTYAKEQYLSAAQRVGPEAYLYTNIGPVGLTHHQRNTSSLYCDPNPTPVPPVDPDLTPTSPLTTSIPPLSILDTPSSNPYSLTYLEIGAKPFTDREEISITAMPPQLTSSILLQTPVADRVLPSSDLLTINLSQTSDLYLAFDSRARTPSWLSSWQSTGQSITISEGSKTFDLYKSAAVRVISNFHYQHSPPATSTTSCLQTPVLPPTLTLLICSKSTPVVLLSKTSIRSSTSMSMVKKSVMLSLSLLI
jgi:hypothetical protein